jgi:cytochrome c oxidase subunit IV
MSDATEHGEHTGMGHAVPWPILVGVWLALMALTFITVAVTYVDLGPLNIVIAMGVATVKGALVVLFFMHLFWDRALNAVTFLLSLAFVTVFLAFTIVDSKQYQGAIAERELDFLPAEPEPPAPLPNGDPNHCAMPNFDEDTQPIFDKYKSIVAGGEGSADIGKPIFEQRCAVCHKLGKEGKDIGPDLTTFERTNAECLVANIAAPSGRIRPGYENYLFKTKEKGVIVGVPKGAKFEKDKIEGTEFTVHTSDGKEFVFKPDEIKSFKQQPVSLMPSGLFDGLTDDQVRGLIKYIQSVPAQ